MALNDMDRQGEVAVAIRDLSKSFGPTRALDAVSFTVRRGEIHGLLGGNGSGKSTLIKILAGIYRADPGGTITLSAGELAADSLRPAVARHYGLRFVHQNPGVFPALSVAENMAIGVGFPRRAGQIRWSALHRRTAELLDRFEVDARPGDLLETLRPAEQTMVAIARALQDDGDTAVLVLDEPTASLPRHEVGLLLDALGRYAARGQTILFVSHRIDETLTTVDAITVLRDGRHVITRPAAGLTEAELIRHIVGRPLDRVFPPARAKNDAPTFLSVSGLSAGPLRDVSFHAARGEVVGIAGLLGSGRSRLLRTLFGANRAEAGTVLLDGQPLAARTPAAAMAAGVAYIPEARETDAAYPELSVRENLSMGQIGTYFRHGILHRAPERHDAEASVAQFSIKSEGLEQPLSTLSGGNQQKVILARWLRRSPRLLLLDEPSQGVDVGARADVYAAVRAAADTGTTTLIVSSDFEELVQACDRVLVLRDGRIVEQLEGEALDSARLGDIVYATEAA
jgi:ribose transport system ATP-binding protein